MENVKKIIASAATKAVTKALDISKDIKEQIPSWATSKASSKNPEMIVTEYEENYPNGVIIESDRASVRSYYARNDHTAIRWHIEPEVGHADYAEVLTKIIGETSSNQKAGKFARHASSILHGRRQNWVLYKIVVYSSELIFLYENQKTENVGFIQLDLRKLSVPLIMCVGFESSDSNKYEISYDPADEDIGCHVFCRYLREGSTREVTFLKDSIKAHVFMRRPKDAFDR